MIDNKQLENNVGLLKRRIRLSKGKISDAEQVKLQEQLKDAEAILNRAIRDGKVITQEIRDFDVTDAALDLIDKNSGLLPVELDDPKNPNSPNFNGGAYYEANFKENLEKVRDKKTPVIEVMQLLNLIDKKQSKDGAYFIPDPYDNTNVTILLAKLKAEEKRQAERVKYFKLAELCDDKLRNACEMRIADEVRNDATIEHKLKQLESSKPSVFRRLVGPKIANLIKHSQKLEYIGTTEPLARVAVKQAQQAQQVPNLSSEFENNSVRIF